VEEAEIQGADGESDGSSCLIAGIERRAVNLRLDLVLDLETTKRDETSATSMSDSVGLLGSSESSGSLV